MQAPSGMGIGAENVIGFAEEQSAIAIYSERFPIVAAARVAAGAKEESRQPPGPERMPLEPQLLRHLPQHSYMEKHMPSIAHRKSFPPVNDENLAASG